jgi:hypothetical protein
MNDRIDEQFCKSKIAALPVLRTWPGTVRQNELETGRVVS